MKSMVISTAIILAIGLGGSFFYQAFAAARPAQAAMIVHHDAADRPVGWACGGTARVVLVPA